MDRNKGTGATFEEAIANAAVNWKAAGMGPSFHVHRHRVEILDNGKLRHEVKIGTYATIPARVLADKYDLIKQR